MARLSYNSRFLVIVSLVIVFAPISVAADSPAGPHAVRTSVGCGANVAVLAGESVVRTIKVGELEREYRLHLPAGYDTRTAVPLVLAFHGYTTSAEKLENEYTSFSRHADQNGYVMVYPQATAFEVGGNLITSWNDLACNASPSPDGPICTEGAFDYPTPPECGEPRECDWCTCHDDVAFVVALLDEVEASLCVDLDRVFATGMSNGGMFVHRLGCDLSERFAAIAPVGGTIARGFNCAPAALPKISMINFHGTRDRTVPFDGKPASDGFLYTPTAQVMEAWAGPDSQQCSSETSPYPTPKDGIKDFECIQRADCATGAEVVDCGWNGGHDGKDQFSVDVIWQFFEKNAR